MPEDIQAFVECCIMEVFIAHVRFWSWLVPDIPVFEND